MRRKGKSTVSTQSSKRGTKRSQNRGAQKPCRTPTSLPHEWKTDGNLLRRGEPHQRGDGNREHRDDPCSGVEVGETSRPTGFRTAIRTLK
ncbi:Hypothetical predicted protein, partial [Marmota monax]